QFECATNGGFSITPPSRRAPVSEPGGGTPSTLRRDFFLARWARATGSMPHLWFTRVGAALTMFFPDQTISSSLTIRKLIQQAWSIGSVTCTQLPRLL